MAEFFGFTTPVSATTSGVEMSDVSLSVQSVTDTTLDLPQQPAAADVADDDDDDMTDEAAAAADVVAMDTSAAVDYPEHVKQAIVERHEHAQRLVDCIKSDAVKSHMYSVEGGEMQSRYVTEYHAKSRTARGRSELRSIGFGPISDSDDLVLQIVDTLEGYLEEYNSTTAGDISAHDAAIRRINNTKYILYGWVPEATVRAIELVTGCSRAEAETTFARGVVWTDEELENKWQTVVKSSSRLV